MKYYGDGTAGPEGQGLRARGFDLDSKVQVFETVIRGVGGLLSAHLFATGDLPIRGYNPVVKTTNGKTGVVWKNGLVYDGQLLRLAYDLAQRLLPAFYTATSIPYPRVNLRHGIPFYANSPLNVDAERGQCPASQQTNAEITETCSAGAGSLVLEFTTLSRLTGDNRFEQAAKDAFWAIWSRRSSIGLIGSGIDAESGQWISPYTGIGAGIDSFFEYAFKSYVLLSGIPYDSRQSTPQSPDDFLTVWEEAHAAIKRHIFGGSQHPHYVQVDLFSGAPRALWIDALSAYYPGLLALAGELEEAITAHLLYTALWTRYSAIPERWSTSTGNIENGLRWWIGRPEFIESTWYIYRATKDPWYLHVGEMALRDVKRRCWTKCGWAGLQDVRTGEKMDRMESFFLGETVKYLFLLFDEGHPLNNLDDSIVFTTEGHPLKVPKQYWNNGLSNDSMWKGPILSTRPITRPPVCPLPPPDVPFSISATAARKDIFHAASLARLHLMPNIETLESPLMEFNADHPSISLSDLTSPSNYTYYPWTLPPELIPANAISAPMASKLTFDLSFPNFPEKAPAAGSLQRVLDGILVNSMSGLRLHMVKEAIKSFVSGAQDYGDHFRVYAVSNVALGRDEKVFLTRDLVSDFNPVDPYFTRTRDLNILDVVLDIPNDSSDLTNALVEEANASIPEIVSEALESHGLAGESSILTSWLSKIFTDSKPVSQAPPALIRHYEPASVPTGPGAAPIEDMDNMPLPTDSESPLLWHDIAFVGQLCGPEVLPAETPKNHQVIVILRGGCNFSEKLRYIPSFAPSAHSLQLVVVISDEEHAEHPQDEASEIPLIQPYLDQPQLTPAGLPRPHPIPMVMVGGGQGTLARFLNAKGVGVRRRWWFESQGVRIGNLIVL